MPEKKEVQILPPLLPRGVILDMDGLMLDTERLYTKIFERVSSETGRPVPMAIIEKTIGMNDDDSEILYKEKMGADFPYRKIWKAVLNEVYNYAENKGLPHRPGLMVLLDKLESLSIPLAVATSTSSENARWRLERAGILHRFKAFAFGNEVKNTKPDPEIFLLALDRLGIKAEDCIGFEDSPAGLLGLKAAGIRSVFIKDLAEPSPEILSNVWRTCTDLEEAALLFG